MCECVCVCVFVWMCAVACGSEAVLWRLTQASVWAIEGAMGLPVAAVVAATEGGGIGLRGQLPWKLK